MKIRSSLLNKLAAKAIVALLRVIFRTVRVTIHQAESATAAYEPLDEKFLYAVWHDGIVFPLFCGPIHDMSTLVSQHRDGSLLATAMECLGVAAVRGSSSHGGAEAMRQMVETAKRLHITITPDGPRGPRRKLDGGIIRLSSKAQRRIVPVAGAASRCWRLKGNWTDLVIPKPFSKVHFVVGPAISIRPRMPKTELGSTAQHVEQCLQATQLAADRLAAGEQVEITELCHMTESGDTPARAAA